MSETTSVEWTNTYLPSPVLWKKQMTSVIPGATFNPWWGCQKVSRACKHCYAETFANRFYPGLWAVKNSVRRMFDDKHWNQPLHWNAVCQTLGITRKVFCGSMCDWAEKRDDLIEPRKRLFKLIDDTPYLTWLMLTKRPEEILDLLPDKWKSNPPRNVWQGTTIESESEMSRIIHLIKVPAVIRFISCEPLMSDINLKPFIGPVPHMGVPEIDQQPIALFGDRYAKRNAFYVDYGHVQSGKVHWVIAGGESGQKSEPTSPEHFISLMEQCKEKNVPFFFKQWGGVNKKLTGRVINGRTYDQMPGMITV